jgi:hypothetical protein
LQSDGTVVAWDNGGPLTVAGTFTAISADAGLRADGTVQDFWDTYSPVGTFTSIAWGGDFDIGIRSDGSLAAWGYWLYVPPPSTLPSGGRFTQISAGPQSCWAALEDDGVVAVGMDQTPYVEPLLGTFTSVSAGCTYVLAIQASPVPEPSSLLALVCGIAGMGGIILHRHW